MLGDPGFDIVEKRRQDNDFVDLLFFFTDLDIFVSTTKDLVIFFQFLDKHRDKMKLGKEVKQGDTISWFA